MSRSNRYAVSIDSKGRSTCTFQIKEKLIAGSTNNDIAYGLIVIDTRVREKISRVNVYYKSNDLQYS